MSKPDLAARHAGAGERYSAAVGEMIDALVDLAAIEGALPADPLHTFAADVRDEWPELRHRRFVPTLPKSVRALVVQRRGDLDKGAA
jgi:hypothetical protein